MSGAILIKFMLGVIKNLYYRFVVQLIIVYYLIQ